MAQQSFHEKVASIARKLAHTGARASSRASLQCQAIRSGHPWCLGWWEVRQLSIGMVFWIEFMVIACHRIEIYNAITTWNRKSKDPNKRLNSRFLSAGLLRAWLQNVAETFFTRCRSKLRCGARKPKWIQLGAPLKVQKNNCGTLIPLLLQKVLTDTYKETCKYQLFKKFLKFSNASKMGNSSSITFGMYHLWKT